MRTYSEFAPTFVALLVICLSPADASFFDREYDCQVTEWTSWSEPFGFGQISRHRKILRHPSVNGLPCPELEEIQYTGVPLTSEMMAESLAKNFIQPATYGDSTTQTGQGGHLRDLLIIMDSSESVGLAAFTSAKLQLGRLLGLLCPLDNPFEQGYQHVAMLRYSTRVSEIFDFKTHTSTTAVQNGINQTSYDKGLTCTDLAFNHVRDMYTPEKGARFVDGVKREVLIITDGLSNCGDAVAAAKEVHEIADVFGLMIGTYSQYGMDELTKYVSTPAATHLFSIPNYHMLAELVDLIVAEKRERGQNWCAHFEKK